MGAKAYTFVGLLLTSGLLVFGVIGTASGDAGRDVSGDELAIATFAGGCFWCMEHPFDELEGVISTTVGYTGGHKKDPNYEEVSAGGTGHAEAVQVVYNPKKISYDKLLEVFWRNIDPLTKDRQFCDSGSQYRSAIFFHGDSQKGLAEQSKKALEESKRFQQPIVTEITPASEFYAAEDYHQNYYRTHPVRYKFYRYACGRDRRLHELWGETK
ncbi:MAG: peptide-methionine (S)-S-oxide reductase MsrA [Nitrospiraceae bacterium]